GRRWCGRTAGRGGRRGRRTRRGRSRGRGRCRLRTRRRWRGSRAWAGRTSPRGRGCGSTGLLRLVEGFEDALGVVGGDAVGAAAGAHVLGEVPHPLQGGLGLLGALAEQRQLAAPAQDAGVAPLLAVGAPGAGSRSAVLAALTAVVALEALRARLGGGQGAHRVSFLWRRSFSVSARIASARALASAACRPYAATGRAASSDARRACATSARCWLGRAGPAPCVMSR